MDVTTRGVNATGDASPAIFGQPGTGYLISPPKFVIAVVIIIRLNLTKLMRTGTVRPRVNMTHERHMTRD